MPLAEMSIDCRIFLLLVIFMSADRSGHKWAKAADATAMPSNELASFEEHSNGINDTIALAYIERKLSRGKRFLDFVKGTRLSWRLVVKNNILKVNTLWAYGYGFRTNYPIPNKEDRLRPFNKRDLFHTMENFLEQHGFDGRACVLKSYCMALKQGPSDGGGMVFKILQLLFRAHSDDSKALPYLNSENCQQILYSHCPLSFDSLSPYTDVNY